MNIIICGLGYGDEGKGVVTNHYARTLSGKNIVVRYGGGNQVGHTVHEDILHEFHHMGSGTLVGVPTYYSEYCTVDPVGFLKEYEELKQYKPVVLYHPKCMIVTPYDVRYNRIEHLKNGHGTVGLGFGATVGRNENHRTLYVSDIECEYIFIEKMKAIYSYYYPSDNVEVAIGEIKFFYKYCKEFLAKVNIATSISHYTNFIFEGHQGVLLDMEYGVFPHVTRSKTTPKNALNIMRSLGKLDNFPTVVGVTRAYHTRHGNGPFEEAPIELINNENESNKDNPWQGKFKKSPLRLDLLKYAFNKMQYDSPGCFYKLAVTCLDQVNNSHDILNSLRSTISNKIYCNYSTKSNLSEN